MTWVGRTTQIKDRPNDSIFKGPTKPKSKYCKDNNRTTNRIIAAFEKGTSALLTLRKKSYTGSAKKKKNIYQKYIKVY